MKQLSIVFVILLLAAPALQAEQGDLPLRTSGFYAGAGASYSQTDLNSVSLDISGSDFGFKVFGGYRFQLDFLPFGTTVAIEGGYVKLGEIDDTVLGSSLQLEIDGFELYAVGTVPLFGQFDLFAEAGVIAWDGELSTGGTLLIDDSGTDLALGIGLSYHTGGPLSARAELENFDFMDGAWLMTLSVIYQFK